MTVCQNCQTENRTGAEFCGSCGESILRDSSTPNLTKPAKIRKKISGLTILLAILVPGIALGAAFVLVFGAPNLIPFEVGGAQAKPDESVAPRLNAHGVPLSCDESDLAALATDILVDQQDSKDKIVIDSTGYSMSFVDARNIDSNPPLTSDPTEYQHLTCSYKSSLDSNENYNKSVLFEFDSVAQPRDWIGSISEQEVELNLGEKLMIYYSDGSGYEYGGGLTWRLWVANSYMQIDTWSADGNGYAILKSNLIGNVIKLLNEKH